MLDDNTTKGTGWQYMKGQATRSIVTASVISKRRIDTKESIWAKFYGQRTDKSRWSMELLLLYFYCSLFLDPVLHLLSFALSSKETKELKGSR